MTEAAKPLGQRVYEVYVRNREEFPDKDPKDALAEAYREINPPNEVRDFIESDMDDKRPPKAWWDSCYNTIHKKNPGYSDEQIRQTCGHLWYHKQIKKKIHDFLKFQDLLKNSNLEHITFKEVSLETDDFIIEDALSIKPWLERWKTARFFAPDLPLSEAATAGKKTSTNISWIGYDKKQLRVGFNNGKVYEYDVEPKFYKYMAGAPSKGQFLWNYLRGRAPGRVIDKPWKETPGGVGGSIVPYNKIIGRRLPERQIRRIQKKFAGAIERGTQLKEVSKMRARKAEKTRVPKVMTAGQQALIQKLEKRYRKDFEVSDSKTLSEWIACCMRKHGPKGDGTMTPAQCAAAGYAKFGKSRNDFDIFDTISVQGHTRNIGGHEVWIPAFERKGEKKQETIKKAREKGKTPLPEAKKIKTSKSEEVIKKWLAERKEAKKSSGRGLTPKERIRKEIDRQARGVKTPKELPEREKAIQKLIEQTGYTRERAEAEIRKKLGPSKEEQKANEKKQKQFEQKTQQLRGAVLKLQLLNQKKYKSDALRNILQLFTNVVQGKKPLDIAKKFTRNYIKLKRDQRIDLQKKAMLLNVIDRLNREINSLSPKQDFEVADTDKKSKDGLERCIAWMEKKGETEDPEGTCYGILRGFAKKRKEKEERKKKHESMVKKSLQHIQKERKRRLSLRGLKKDVAKYQRFIQDNEHEIEMMKKRIEETRQKLQKYKSESEKLHWVRLIEDAKETIKQGEQRRVTYQKYLKNAKQKLRERKTEEKDLYFSRQELHQHFRELKEDDPYLQFPTRFHKNLQFAKNVNLSGWFINRNLGKWDEALRFLPTSFQNAAEIRIYNEITDDPDNLGDPDKPPKSYEEVGWDRKNRSVRGEIDYKYRRIRIKADGSDPRGTIWHEIGHAVWHYGKWRFYEQSSFANLWNKMKSTLASEEQVGQYQINNIGEFFAVQFERYYTSKWELKNYGKVYEYTDKPLPEVSKWFEYNLGRYNYDKNFIRGDLSENIENFIQRRKQTY